MTAIKHSTSQWWQIRTDELETRFLQGKQCMHQPLPITAGIGHTDFYHLDGDLSYIETCYTPSKNLAVRNSIDLQEPRMVVTLTLKGHSSFKSQTGDEILFSEGFTTITTFNSSVGERLYEASKETTQLRFSFSKQWVARYLDEKLANQLFVKNRTQQISFRPVSSQGINAAQQLLTCDLEGNVKRMYMRGQAMVLLASELNHLASDNRCGSESFNLRDMNTAQAARDILLREFRDPPSVHELSRRVGINQFKLKQLFHHYFSNTPYGLLLEVRMRRAYELLESTRCQVGYAADYVGYSHASNFTAAFINFFGFPPKHLTKNKS